MSLASSHPAALLEAERDARQLGRLRLMRAVATGLFVAMLGLFLVARSLHGQHPAWGFVEAFAEAAMVGALADWFAVVALFRHPLGIPLWHTAIIPNSKDDIARNLGEFVETHFITAEAIVARIRGFEPARRLAQWLQHATSAERIGRLVTEAARRLLAGLDDRALRERLHRLALERLSQYPLQRPVAQLAEQLVSERRHHELMDWALRESVLWLESEAAQIKVAGLLDEALGVENKFLRALTSAGAVRLKDSLKATAVAALDDPRHPLRERYEAYVREWLVRLRTDPALAQRLAEFQRGVLESEPLRACLDGLWSDARAWLEQDLAQPQPRLGEHAARLARECGRRLDAEPALRAWIDDTLADAAAPLVADNRGKVAAYIQAQIDAWSREEMTQRIELAVGRDLQFIRINGTLVGGLVGTAIHALLLWA